MEKFLKKIYEKFSVKLLNIPFKEIGIDSIELITVRVNLERLIGFEISDKIWFNFNTFEHIYNYVQAQENKDFNITSLDYLKPFEKSIIINMPNMANGALSENWIFKELGNIHWEQISNGLELKSNNIIDEQGNRLYSSFARIKIQINDGDNFVENDELKIIGEINRLGKSSYFSECIMFDKEKNERINAKLMSIFVNRENKMNSSLQKSNPLSKTNLIKDIPKLPYFGSEYSLLKKGFIENIKFGGIELKITNDVIFEHIYTINANYDINGVGLLYFASYPIINDFCEAQFFNEQNNLNLWNYSYLTQERDVFYYGNCDINDKIIYKLNCYEFLNEKKQIKLLSSLYRKSDNKLMARIFTLKKIRTANNVYNALGEW